MQYNGHTGPCIFSAKDVEIQFNLRGQTLTAVRRASLDLYEGDTQVKIVADALMDGPEQSELLPVMPGTWKNLSVWVKENTCYVNLPTALLTEEITEAQVQLALEALGRSLCGLETVEDVRFLVDGAFAAQYGTVDVSAAYTE